MKRGIALLAVLALIFSACDSQDVTDPAVDEAQEEGLSKRRGDGPSGDPAVIAMMLDINEQLAAQGLGIAIESIEFLTLGAGRPSNRIHQQPFRWVPNDPRRLADGTNITYMIDESAGATASGLSSADTKMALQRALSTWDSEKCLSKVDVVQRADDGADNTIFDSFFFPFPPFGNPFAADIVQAGWLPRAFFEAVGGPGGGRGILAFSVTFTFTGTDINGDNYLDTALNEVYYNDTFGDPGDDRAGNPWDINVNLPGIDVETVGLHENGHSLGIGHFGPPPAALMNPFYADINISPDPADRAGMCAVWASWPNP